MPAPANPVDWSPTLEDVAALLHARTFTKGGGQLGSFGPDTRPTDTETQQLIDAAAREITLLMDPPPVAPNPDDPKYATDYDGTALAADTVDYDAHVSRWTDHVAAAKTCVGYRAAMLIELSFFPEESLGGEGQLAYQTLRLSYETALGRLRPRRVAV